MDISRNAKYWSFALFITVVIQFMFLFMNDDIESNMEFLIWYGVKIVLGTVLIYFLIRWLNSKKQPLNLSDKSFWVLTGLSILGILFVIVATILNMNRIYF